MTLQLGWVHAITAVVLFLAHLLVVARALTRPNRTPASRVAWVAVIMLAPLVGMFAYLLLGETSIGRTRFRRLQRVRQRMARLDDEQRAIMRTHPERGERIFAATGRSDAAEVARLIRAHHEAFDGGGYPDGLKGSAIPLGARVLTIVDGYDAMTSARPYRGPMPHAKAMGILADQQGGLIDPEVFGLFTRMMAATT